MVPNGLIEQVGKIRAATATDPALKARFVANPMAFMALMGISFPEGVLLEAGAGPEGAPAAAVLRFPLASDSELSDEMLEGVSGGAYSGEFNRHGGWCSYSFA